MIITTKQITLSFPAHWTCSPQLHPQAFAITQTVTDWLIENNLIQPGDSLYRMTQAIRPGEFVGYAFPQASFDRLVDLGKLWTSELLWDEVDVETNSHGHAISAQDLLHVFDVTADTEVFLPIKHPLDYAPYKLLAQLHHVLRTMYAKHGANFIQRHAEEIVLWYRAAKAEQAMAQAFQRGQASFSAQEFFENRCITVGSTVGMNMEYAYGYDMPPQFHQEPAILALKNTAAALVAMSNDVASLGKDAQQNWPNNISVRMALYELTLDEALESIEQDFQHYCEHFDLQAAALLANDAFIAAYPETERYIQDIRVYTSGLALWELHAERYAANRLQVNGQLYVPSIAFAEEAVYALPA